MNGDDGSMGGGEKSLLPGKRSHLLLRPLQSLIAPQKVPTPPPTAAWEWEETPRLPPSLTVTPTLIETTVLKYPHRYHLHTFSLPPAHQSYLEDSHFLLKSLTFTF